MGKKVDVVSVQYVAELQPGMTVTCCRVARWRCLVREDGGRMVKAERKEKCTRVFETDIPVDSCIRRGVINVGGENVEVPRCRMIQGYQVVRKD